MAENFRNKQWFKKLSQNRKDEICKYFDIDEKTLRKAGRETDDGRIVVDLLRVDHLMHYPKEWDDTNKALNNRNEFLNKLKNCNTVSEYVEVFKSLFNLFNKNTYLKYKQSLHNDMLVKNMYRYILNDLENYFSVDDKEYKAFYSYRTFSHLRVLLVSDLGLTNS